MGMFSGMVRRANSDQVKKQDNIDFYNADKSSDIKITGSYRDYTYEITSYYGIYPMMEFSSVTNNTDGSGCAGERIYQGRDGQSHRIATFKNGYSRFYFKSYNKTGDYRGYPDSIPGKKYTVQELLADCMNIIDDLYYSNFKPDE